MSLRRLFVLAPLALAACGVPQPVDLVVQNQVELTDVEPVGVALDDAGTPMVLDAMEGLFQLDGDGLILVAGPEALERDGQDLRPYTDVVSMGGATYAVTVENDGLRLDVETQTTTQHFCYLPGDDLMEVEPSRSQLTHGVAYDPVGDTLYAQPQTFEGGQLVGAQIGTYSGEWGGQPEGWFDLKDERFMAEGMVWDGDHLLLASQGTLYTYDLPEDRARPYVDLSEIGAIRGMALRADDTLVLVTPTRLLEVTGWRPE